MRHFEPRFIRPDVKAARRTLRQQATTAEKILWRHVRGNQLGYKFRRQFDIQSFIVDFYCHALRLVVELDGWTHDSQKTKQRDSVKQHVLEKTGCRVIRFTNEQIYGDIEKVLHDIVTVCEARAKELGVVK